MINRQPHIVFVAVSLTLALVVTIFFSRSGEPKAGGPIISWEPSQVVVSVPAGAEHDVQVTATISEDIDAVIAELVPGLVQFVSVEPSSLPSLQAGLQQIFTITFRPPEDTTPTTIDGTLHIRKNFRTIARPLPITLNITEPEKVLSAKGLELTIPSTWSLDQTSLDLGGPISINNFGGVYRQGGIRPLGGAEIDVTNIQLPTLTIQETIDRDLQGTTIESTTTVQVGGEDGTKVVYSFDLLPSFVEKNLAVYVPHNQLLYKFFLSYNLGDAQEAEFLETFEQFLAGVQFTE